MAKLLGHCSLNITMYLPAGHYTRQSLVPKTTEGPLITSELVEIKCCPDTIMIIDLILFQWLDRFAEVFP
mgnify:CR=1 FL=1